MMMSALPRKRKMKRKDRGEERKKKEM